jgi:hypothetical protein
MIKIWRRSPKATKLLASLAVLGITASMAGLGTFASFTTSTTANQTVGSGSLTIALGATGASTNRLTVNATNVAPGDTIQRSFDLTNSGTVALAAAPTLTTTASPSSVLDTDATNGLQMTIDKCSVAWTEAGSSPAFTYTCSGSTSTVLASRAVIGSSISLSNVSDLVTPSTTDHLRLTLTLPSGAGDTFQSKSSTITYAFAATQRSGTNQ